MCFTQYTFYCLFKTTCPGSLLHDFPRGDFCRLIALSDGTVVNQEAVTETLCLEPSIKYTKGRIGQDFLDTNSRKLSRLLFNARCLAKLLLLNCTVVQIAFFVIYDVSICNYTCKYISYYSDMLLKKQNLQ